MEILDVVDENNNFIVKTENREIVHRDGLWHREVAIWVVNENNEILIQKRASTKKTNPDKWDVTAGHIDSGEDAIKAAKREVLEELGLDVNDGDLEFLMVIRMSECFSNGVKNNMFNHIYCVKTSKKLSEYIIQKEEVSEIKYISIKELEKIVETKDSNYVFAGDAHTSKIIEMLKR